MTRLLRFTTTSALAATVFFGLTGLAAAQDGEVVPAEPGAGAPPPAAPPAAAPTTPPPGPAGDEPCPPGEERVQPGQPCTRKATEPPGSAPGSDLGNPGSSMSSADQDMAASSIGIRELEDHSYWFLGMRFRDFIIPKFMINLFVEGGSTVNAFEFGPELTYRRGPLELDMHLGYADYSMDNFLFKEKDDPDRAFEKASSDMKLLVASIDIMANIPIDKEGRFQFLIGGDVGIAGVLGNLYRAQAYPKNGKTTANPDNPGEWALCRGAGSPNVLDKEGSPYCDASNNHYNTADGIYEEPSLANGGGVPFVVPYLALPHIALRAKPFADTQVRFDTGFSITGFFFGLGAGYRLPI